MCSSDLAMPNAGFALSVETLGSRGELAQVSKLINRFSDIISATTLEKTDMDTKGQILYALPSSLDPVEFNQLVKQLERRGYRIRSYLVEDMEWLQAQGLIGPETTLVCETDDVTALPEVIAGYQRYQHKRYGQTQIHFYGMPEAD